MKPSTRPTGLPEPETRLAPLFTRGAHGSLGAADLEALGVTVVAVDVLELALEVGLDRLRALGGLPGLTGWRGEFVAVGRWEPTGSTSAHRRAAAAGSPTGRRHTVLERVRGDRLEFWSSTHGNRVSVTAAELAGWASDFGAAALFGPGPAPSAAEWSSGPAPPTGPVVFTDLDLREAQAGRYLGAEGWAGLDGAVAPRLVAGCTCRACEVATPVLLRHLHAQREITATHLLSWHNLQRMLSIAAAM